MTRARVRKRRRDLRFRRFHRKNADAVRLVRFPHAGGSARQLWANSSGGLAAKASEVNTSSKDDSTYYRYRGPGRRVAGVGKGPAVSGGGCWFARQSAPGRERCR
jgi:hypothetical protein